jgi:hypothetical protein
MPECLTCIAIGLTETLNNPISIGIRSRQPGG